jgi:hypothetical protein
MLHCIGAALLLLLCFTVADEQLSLLFLLFLRLVALLSDFSPWQLFH